MLYIEGLLLGLSNNIICIGICAPFVFPFVLNPNYKTIYPIVFFLSGRLIAYITFAIFATNTLLYLDTRFNPIIFTFLTTILGLWMTSYALGIFKYSLPLCKILDRYISGRYIPLFAGFVSSLNLCPPLLLAISKTIEVKNIINSILFFIFFFIGSSIWLLLPYFTGYLKDIKLFYLLGKLVAGVTGGWYFYKGIKILINLYL